MALAPPIESTLLDDFWTKRARGVDVTGAIQPKATTQGDVDAALAYGLQNQKDKRLAAISQQNADTARFAAEQEARALDKSIDMNRTALPFQLAQQAFGAQGLIPWLFGGKTGTGAGATEYPGLINQAGSALGTIGGGLSSAYNWLTGGGTASQSNPFADAERQGLEEAGATAEAGGAWGIGGTPTDWLSAIPAVTNIAGDIGGSLGNIDLGNLGDYGSIIEDLDMGSWFNNLDSAGLENLLGNMDWGQNIGQIESALGDWDWQSALPDVNWGDYSLFGDTAGNWGSWGMMLD